MTTILQGNAAETSSEGNTAPVEFSSQVVEALAKAEAERMMPGASESDRKAKEKDIAERMVTYPPLQADPFSWIQ